MAKGKRADKQLEQAVRRSEAWLRGLIDTTQDAIISLDRQGRIVEFNPAAERIFGYTKVEVQGQKVNMLMPEPYQSEHDGYITHYERTQEPHAIGRIRTVAARRKSGEIFPIELSVTEILADDDVRYGAFIRDISEKVRLQEQLIERERLAAVGVISAKLAHEIGNPLNGMYMATQLLERRLAKHTETLDEKIPAGVRSLMNEMTRLSHLLQEFRSLSRYQQLSVRPLDLAALITEILTIEAPFYADKKIHIALHVQPTLPLVAADKEKLKQVFLNLFKNAVEAMPQGGALTITIRVQPSGARIQVEVADTGRGVPAGINIFEPFTTTKPEGTGLGLPIVQQIVTAHGGTVTYTSASDVGTTFVVELPLASPKTEPSAGESRFP